MNSADLAQIEAIIRRVIREEGLAISSTATPLAGDATFLQRSAEFDERAQQKIAKLAAKLAKKNGH